MHMMPGGIFPPGIIVFAPCSHVAVAAESRAVPGDTTERSSLCRWHPQVHMARTLGDRTLGHRMSGHPTSGHPQHSKVLRSQRPQRQPPPPLRKQRARPCSLWLGRHTRGRRTRHDVLRRPLRGRKTHQHGESASRTARRHRRAGAGSRRRRMGHDRRLGTCRGGAAWHGLDVRRHGWAIRRRTSHGQAPANRDG